VIETNETWAYRRLIIALEQIPLEFTHSPRA
jgi:hypothetical protein